MLTHVSIRNFTPIIAMILTQDQIQKISEHPFLKVGGADFMRLWDVKSVHNIYEIVLINVAIKEKVHWKKIYDFNPSSFYYTHLCVAILLIYDALKFVSAGEINRDSYLQQRELDIVKSYSLT